MFKRANFILFGIVLIAYMACGQAHGWEFKEFEHLKMLKEHPQYESYEPEVGRFKGTDSEIIPMQELEERIENLKGLIASLKEQKGSLVSASMIFDMDSEANQSWEQIARIDEELLGVEAEVEALKVLWEEGGIPGQETIFGVVQKMTMDVKAQIKALSDEGVIVLNKLPVYQQGLSMPELDNQKSGYGLFLKTKEKKALEAYIKHAYSIGLFFEGAADVILYEKGARDAK
jgi:hypothetical protein